MDPTAATYADGVPSLILTELKRLNERLDQVESKVEDSQRASKDQQRDSAKLSSISGITKPVKHC